MPGLKVEKPNVVSQSDRIRALKIFNKKKQGKVSETIKDINGKDKDGNGLGQAIFDEFFSLGIIIGGSTATAQTWKISKLGKIYRREIK
jgi:hypothetical protein